MNNPTQAPSMDFLTPTTYQLVSEAPWTFPHEGGITGPVTIYVSGSWKREINQGDWRAVLQWMDGDLNRHEHELSGTKTDSSQNKLPLEAAIAAIQTLGQAETRVEVVSNSGYVVDCMSRLVHKWKKAGWLTPDGTPPVNLSLFKWLYALCKPHIVSWRKPRWDEPLMHTSIKTAQQPSSGTLKELKPPSRVN